MNLKNKISSRKRLSDVLIFKKKHNKRLNPIINRRYRNYRKSDKCEKNSNNSWEKFKKNMMKCGKSNNYAPCVKKVLFKKESKKERGSRGMKKRKMKKKYNKNENGFLKPINKKPRMKIKDKRILRKTHSMENITKRKEELEKLKKRIENERGNFSHENSPRKIVNSDKFNKKRNLWKIEKQKQKKEREKGKNEMKILRDSVISLKELSKKICDQKKEKEKLEFYIKLKYIKKRDLFGAKNKDSGKRYQ